MRENIAKIAVFVIDFSRPRIYDCNRERGEVKLSHEPSAFNFRQTMKRPDFELQYKRDSYLKKVKLHHHDFYEIFFLISGDVTYSIESKLYRVAPGDILLISPRELHQLYIRTEREVYERYVLWVDARTVERLSTRYTNLMSCLDPRSPGYHNQLHMSDRKSVV